LSSAKTATAAAICRL